MNKKRCFKIKGEKGFKGKRILGKKGFEVIGDIPTWLITALVIIIFVVLFKISGCFSTSGLKESTIALQASSYELKISYDTLNFLRQPVEIDGKELLMTDLIIAKIEDKPPEYVARFDEKIKFFDKEYGKCYELIITKGSDELKYGTSFGGIPTADRPSQTKSQQEMIKKKFSKFVYFLPAQDGQTILFKLYISHVINDPSSLYCEVD